MINDYWTNDINIANIGQVELIMKQKQEIFWTNNNIYLFFNALFVHDVK